MASWREVEQEVPELATRVREAFARGKHATMATLRADGSPRISGTEVEFTDDGCVRLGSMPGAVKARDLLRDPRVAVHSPTAEPGEGGADWPGEAKVAGRAVAHPQGEDGPGRDPQRAGHAVLAPRARVRGAAPGVIGRAQRGSLGGPSPSASAFWVQATSCQRPCFQPMPR
jgi:hypothetical protein